MCSEPEGVLHMGKAPDLRMRLSAYRLANAGRLPRQIIRLLHHVRRNELDFSATKEAASYGQKLLICVLQPRFKRAGLD